ncbi:hypothetical protein AQ490_16280 [Wenjunlia vitaminophila]|uniref:MFS transporter n=1 Tax=Wenjunlia vitaminophila TaxID=76728 RepID=A0A0T6LXM2_WENVI|nr:hypothetical protein [Wenjunlia vitaminophila]KRV50758.1 hypothetical protein AQ490_16280 [Wenjunlia vitaminophila]
MRTFHDLFRTPEFTPLFLCTTGHAAATTVSGLALGTLVYSSTGSPLLAALSMFGPSLAQVVGALALLSAADRLPPRAALTGLSLAFCLGTAAQAVPGMPLSVRFTVLALMGLLASLVGGVRYGLLHEILSRDGFLIGRSTLNMTAGTMQICGYALGGALLTTASPRVVLLVAAALHLGAAAVERGGLSRRPPRAAGRISVTRTWKNNALLWSSSPRRHVYLALWVPNGLIVGCESLFVPHAPGHAGLLFAAGAFGMLLGDVLVGRFVPRRWRVRLGAPLRLLLAAPYLVFALRPPLAVSVLAVVVASVGFSASLLLQERLMELTPDELSGHALGLHSCGMLTMQGVGAALAGALAQGTSTTTAMALLALASVTVTLALAPGLRPGGTGSSTTGAAAPDPVPPSGATGG